jgi:hypothetical protein
MYLTISAPTIKLQISMLFRILHTLSILTVTNIFLNIYLVGYYDARTDERYKTLLILRLYYAVPSNFVLSSAHHYVIFWGCGGRYNLQ